MSNTNWLGFYTLYQREVQRFLSIPSQTIVAPVVTTLLFWAIFHFAMGSERAAVGTIPFGQFLVPGLAMMSMIQNAFANTSSSLMIAKMQKNIVDTLMAPLTPFEFATAYILGGITRGLMVGFFVIVIMMLLGLVHIHNLSIIIIWGFLACMMLSTLGLIGGIIAVKWDHLGAFTNFVITPLSFLSGTFYSIQRLPEIGQILAKSNPFFYMIDGFRYGFIGYSDGSLTVGFFVLLISNIVLFYLVYYLLKIGYKLKS